MRIAHSSRKIGRTVLRRVREPLLGGITHVTTAAPVAALTFDDGPHPDYTPRLLDLLARYHARATFFLLGKFAIQYPALVRCMAEAGHAIGNHSWDHASFPFLTGRQRRAQIRACDQAIAPYGQRLFRPPYMEQNLASRLDMLWMRHEVILCDCESGDWYQPDPHHIVQRLMQKVHPGSIVCLHDALRSHPTLTPIPPFPPHPNREAMLTAVELFLRSIGTRLRFLTIPALLRCGRPQRQYLSTMTPLMPRAEAAPV